MANRLEVEMIVEAIAQGFDRVQGELQQTGQQAGRTGDRLARLDRGASEAAGGMDVLLPRSVRIRQEMEDVAEAADRAGQELKEVGDEAQGGGQSVSRNALRWTELSSAVNLAQEAFRFAQEGAQRVYQTLQEGAALETAEIRFGRLAEKIGTTALSLENDLGRATQGMLSDAEAMALATDLMSLGLSKTSDQTVRLTRVASALGMDMNQLSLTLANQTTMRFDAIGVSIEGFDERLASLEEQGLSTQDAFTEAFLQQAEAQIETVGDVADTTEGKLKRLENRWKNMGDEMKRWALDAAMPVIDRHIEMADAADLLDEAFATGAITVSEYNRLQRELGRGGQAAAEGIAAQIGPLVESRQAAWDAQEAEDALRQAMSEGEEGARERGAAMQDLSADYEAYREILDKTAEAERNAAQAAAEAEESRRTPPPWWEDEQALEDAAPGEVPEALQQMWDEAGQQMFEQLAAIHGQAYSEAVSESFDADAMGRMLEDKLTGAYQAPDLPGPSVDTTAADMLAERLGVIAEEQVPAVQGGVNAIDNTPVENLRDLSGESLGNLTDLSKDPYGVEIEGNFVEVNEDLGLTKGLIDAIAGTHHIRFVTHGSGSGATGSGSGTGASGGGQGGHTPSISQNDPVRLLQDRGLVSPTLLR